MIQFITCEHISLKDVKFQNIKINISNTNKQSMNRFTKEVLIH
jgi:hypothetical protein